MSIKEPYEYMRLPEEPTAFRLLRLFPGKSDDEIRFSLHNSSWDPTKPSSAKSYIALSYCWGDKRDTKKSFCDGKELVITRSLHNALHSLRLEDRNITLWADGACIEQNNDDEEAQQEKARQVKNMGGIYRSATEIMIWLGKDVDGHGQRAMKYIEDTASRLCEAAGTSRPLCEESAMNELIRLATNNVPNFTSKTKSQDWKSLHWFFSLDWFSRIWVVQEANAGPKATARCGTTEIDWHAIALVAELFIIRRSADIPPELYKSFVWNAAAMRWREFRHGNSRLETLEFARNFHASFASDHIYALLGLPVFVKEPLNLNPDYSKCAFQVYRDMAEAWISSVGDLNILAFVLNEEVLEGPKRLACDHEKHNVGGVKRLPAIEHEIPTWVPIWSQKHHANVMLKWCSTWDASRTKSMSVSIDENILRAKGITLDRVSEVTSLSNFHQLFPPEGPHNSTSDNKCRRDFWEQQASNVSDSQRMDWLETYSMVFTWGINETWTHTSTKKNAANFQDYLLAYCAKGKRLPFCKRLWLWSDKDGVERIIRIARTASVGRSLFKTKSGYVGQGPSSMEKNDMLCIIYGCKMPMILRRQGDTQYCLLVGETYVHGMMFGEAMHAFDKRQLGDIKEEDFRIY